MSDIVVYEETSGSFPTKTVVGLGAIGLLIWWLFGRRGSGGIKDGGNADYKPVEGVSPKLTYIMRNDGLIYALNNTSGKGYTTQDIIQIIKSQNGILYFTATGDTIQGKYDQARRDFDQAKLVYHAS